MLLQNTLDLSTFEIVRFRIWNQTSNPNDYGIGTKYFNTNSGHEGYNRENIYTETGWRRTAYMDDIEALTNGEGSLGTRVKALEDMLKVDDANDVINTWAEIQAFLDQVQEGTDLMDLLNSKLDKRGGDMTGALKISSAAWANQLTLNGVGQNAGIRFSKDDVQNGILYASGQSLRWYTGDNDVSIITGSNALDQLKGTFLPLTGGTIKGTLAVTSHFSVGGRLTMKGLIAFDQYNETGKTYLLGMTEAGGPLRWYNNSAWNTLLHSGNVGEYNAGGIASGVSTDDYLQGRVAKAWYDWNANTGNGIGTYSYGLYVGAYDVGYGLQIASTIDSESYLNTRVKRNGTWYDWKTIAFTDSDITGNAATATKLKTAVSLWGNSFDGTQSVSGNIRSNNTDFRLYYNTDKIFLQATTGNLILGEDTAADSLTFILGKGIRFGKNLSAAHMTITEEGRVVVGTDRSVDGDRLYSNGRVHIFGASDSVGSLGNMPEVGLIITNGGSQYGMGQWVTNADGKGNIQVSRFDGTATAYALNLNPLGGAVNIASADANTNVLGYLVVSQYLYMNSFLVMNRGKEGIYMTGTSINWHNANNAYTDNLLTFAKDSIKFYQLANFSSRVLIGGAEDDGESALQVKNTMSIGDSGTTYGLRLNRNNIHAWIPENHGYGHGANFGLKIGDTLLGAFSHYRDADGSYFAFIGTDKASPWFAVNSDESAFNVLTKFNAGALIPTGQSLTIGSVTFREIAAGEIEVNGNLHTTGTLASGGKAEEGEGGTGGASGTIREFTIEPPTDNTSSFKLEHSFNTEKVIVQIFGLNGNSGKYEMILTDVEITDANNVTVTFGRKPTEYHKVYVMA